MGEGARGSSHHPIVALGAARRRGRLASWCVAAAFTLAHVACGDTTRDGDGGAGSTSPSTSGSGGDGASGPGSGGAAASSTQSGAGAEQTCDDLGFCGKADDPGCVACAVSEGPCVDELEACVGECQALRACYAACDEDDDSCFTECNGAHPQGISALDTLFGCILCEACPVSCNFDTASCP